jgi:hypothetical protein
MWVLMPACKLALLPASQKKIQSQICGRLQVLHIFPTTIRRRILRHLYLRHVRNAYLFKGVRQKFIDALLGVARIELFMPQADILSDHL